MKAFELFINSHYDIKEAIYYIDFDHLGWRLKDFLDATNLEKLIITGTLSSKQAKSLMEPLIHEYSYNRQRLPKVFEYVSLQDLMENPEEIQALIFEGIKNIKELYPFTCKKPKYLVGEMLSQGISSFALWEEFRNFCQHIQITTTRFDGPPQVLDWDKRDSNIELSVIFPMYNVAPYLDQCIESVTAWKAEYVEFLFVNDGSPDNSREVVLKWAETDSRIKLLDKPNGGCASARQWGLDKARGRYIGFIDPDDYIDETMFKKLLRAAMIGSYEISYCGYKAYYENTKTIEEVDDLIGAPYNKGITNKDQINELITFCRVAIWRGIYLREMIDRSKIHFYTEIRRFDDLPFKVETFAAAKSVITVNEHLYYYRLARPGQDMAADDDRLYVHFPIFAHLNDSIASEKNQQLTDYLQMCKIQTHRFAVEKIQHSYLKEYARQAKADLATTGSFLRTFFMAKKMLGKKSANIYWAIMTGNMLLLRRMKKSQ